VSRLDKEAVPILARNGQHASSSVSTIPGVYFDQDFDLKSPRTFDVVSERSDVVPPTSTPRTVHKGNAPAPRKVLATNAILQELSWYIDTVAHSESLIDKGEAEKPLVEIDTIELLMGEMSRHIQLRDLRGATALQAVVSDLTILRSRIGKVFESKIHDILIGDPPCPIRIDTESPPQVGGYV